MYNISGRFRLYKCEGCGLISLDPQPSNLTLDKHYPSENYYSLKDSSESNVRKLAYKSYNRKSNILIKLLRPFFRSTKIVEEGNLLDIGCGAGTFLKSMKNLNMNVCGIEPSSYNKEVARKNKLEIFNGTLFQAKYKDELFDVVTMNHVFEHVRNPTETIVEISRIMKKGGHLIIGVPNSDSWVFKLLGGNWISIDSPRHLFLYNKRILELYAKKADLAVIKTRCFGNSTFLESLKIALSENKNKNAMKKNTIFDNRFSHYLILPISLLFNIFSKGDTIEITLEKS
ncbi:class I SAM-dependent methyltransferase [archaeon]|nr:class I SAM-dependent methyltransferase [archaeon]